MTTIERATVLRDIDPKAYMISDFIARDYERICREPWELLERRAKVDRHSRGIRDQWLAKASRRKSAIFHEIQDNMIRHIERMQLNASLGLDMAA